MVDEVDYTSSKDEGEYILMSQQTQLTLQDKITERCMNAMFNELYNRTTNVPTQGGGWIPHPIDNGNMYLAQATDDGWYPFNIPNVPGGAVGVWGTLVFEPGQSRLLLAPRGDGNGAIAFGSNDPYDSSLNIPFMLPVITPGVLWYTSPGGGMLFFTGYFT